jgi:hypothetical protein
MKIMFLIIIFTFTLCYLYIQMVVMQKFFFGFSHQGVANKRKLFLHTQHFALNKMFGQRTVCVFLLLN